jgi:integrase
MAGKLKPLDIQREEKPGKYADGDGLYLIVTGPTSKNWSYRYWFKGKERWLGHGSFKDVSLKEARLARDAARLQVRAGVDLVQEKRSAREELKAAVRAEKAKTFEECAQAYIDECWNSWSEKHRNQWPSSLKRYAYPTIGRLTIPEIKPSHIYELLRPIWLEKRETANRVRGRIETIIAKNVDVDDKDFRNPAELTKQLREKLPKRLKRVVQHHPALPYVDAQRFMTSLGGAAGTAAEMLGFLVFTGCRTNEVLGVQWTEIDRSLSTWRIPGARIKMSQDHVVLLSDPALAILDRMDKSNRHHELIFSSPDGTMFSENAMLAVLDRLGYGHVTVHGFRSTSASGTKLHRPKLYAFRSPAARH